MQRVFLEGFFPVKLFLCGDLMFGRGMDQAFSTSCDPELYERSVKDAREYRVDEKDAEPPRFFVPRGTDRRGLRTRSLADRSVNEAGDLKKADRSDELTF